MGLSPNPKELEMAAFLQIKARCLRGSGYVAPRR
jgi:hypothetical protein